MPGLLASVREFRKTDRVLDSEVRRALVETLYASTGSLIVGAVVGSTVAAIVAYRADDIFVSACAAMIAVVAVVRVASALIYHRLLRQEDLRAAGRWERIYEIGAWSYSALLGLLAFATLDRCRDPSLHMVSAATALAYAAGICGRNSGRPKIAISQLSLAALPVAAGLLMWPDLMYRTLGFATIAFVLAMIEITLQLYGAVRRAIVTTHEKRRAAETLQAALTSAEAANSAKSSFLTTMSHEIRTPLNGVLGMAQALSSEPLSPTQKHRVEVIQQSGEALMAILNDVLDLAKVEAGRLLLDETPFDLSNLFTSIHAGFRDLAVAKGLDFTLDLDPEAVGQYLGDEMRLRQIAGNLISNALKFTDEGAVKITVGYDGARLRLSVLDTGIGISEDNLQNIFEKFLQADASTTRRFGGTGLGLALSRELASLMGGDVQVRSELGQGSDFVLSLPLRQLSRVQPVAASEPPAAEPKSEHALLLDEEPTPTRDFRVLCAEDNEINRLVLKALLEQFDVDPVFAVDGAEALATWETRDFDLILMDVQMPVMDGPTAVAAIRHRELATRRPRTPVFALTANVMAHQTAQYLKSGMDGVLAKPISVSELFAVLERVAQEQQQTLGDVEDQDLTEVA